jgi:hypothetical protein
MEREIIELRKQIANANAAAAAAVSMSQQQSQLTPTKQETPSISTPISSAAGVYPGSSGMSADQYMGSHEAVASLLDLRSGFDGSNYMRNWAHQFKRIEDVIVVPERVTELFNL